MFKECFVLEKVHGTSAHVAWKDGQVTFYSGGAKHEQFVALFDQEALKVRFRELGHAEVTVYGEAYGGKMQGMRETYGDSLRFIAFDVKIGEKWLSVPVMDQVASELGFEVVPWEKCSSDVKALDALRDRPSEVAVRRGCGFNKQREGIVIRPLEELTTNNDHRLIVKHKIDKFGERKTTQTVHSVDEGKLKVLSDAREVAEEWVVPERLEHVISHLTVDGVEPSIEQTPAVISEMVRDVYREAAGEIVESKAVGAAIARRTAELFKARLKRQLEEK